MTFETTVFQTLSFQVFQATVAYLILVQQVALGFPPFYKKFAPPQAEANLKATVPWVFVIMAFMLAAIAADQQVFFLGAALTAGWAAWRTRSRVRQHTPGVLPWLVTLPTLRWPMLVFDGWTLGLTGLFAAIMQ